MVLFGNGIGREQVEKPNSLQLLTPNHSHHVFRVVNTLYSLLGLAALIALELSNGQMGARPHGATLAIQPEQRTGSRSTAGTDFLRTTQLPLPT